MLVDSQFSCWEPSAVFWSNIGSGKACWAWMPRHSGVLFPIQTGGFYIAFLSSPSCLLVKRLELHMSSATPLPSSGCSAPQGSGACWSHSATQILWESGYNLKLASWGIINAREFSSMQKMKCFLTSLYRSVSWNASVRLRIWLDPTKCKFKWILQSELRSVKLEKISTLAWKWSKGKIMYIIFFFKLVNRLLSVYISLHFLPVITLMKTWNNKNSCLSCKNKWSSIAQLQLMAVFHSGIGTGPNSFTQALSWKITYKRWHSVCQIILINLLNFTQRIVSMDARPRFICYEVTMGRKNRRKFLFLPKNNISVNEMLTKASIWGFCAFCDSSNVPVSCITQRRFYVTV